MRRLTTLAIVASVLVALAAPAHGSTSLKRFASCDAFNKAYPTGVVATKKLAQLAVKDGYQRPRVNAKVAIANDALSPDLPYVCPVSVPAAAPTPDPSQDTPTLPDPQPPSPSSETSPDEAEEVATQAPFRRVDTARESVAYWPNGTIFTPQVVEITVQAPAAIAGTYLVGDRSEMQRGPYTAARSKTWQGTLLPNSGGVINGIASVYVRLDFRKITRDSELPKGKMQCQIRVNGTVVSSVSINYDRNTKGVHCRVTGARR